MDLVRDTLRSLRAHALRFTLTSLGIVWGAFMLTYLSASMEGTDRHFMRALTLAGPKIVFMGGGAVLKDRVGERGARQVELDIDDVARIESIHRVESASPNIELWNEVVRAGRRTKLLNVEGVNEKAERMRNFEPAAGRFLTALEVERGMRTAFLGARAARRLFGDGAPPIGRSLHIDGTRFRVVGVAVEKGAQLVNTGNPDDLKVLIPYTAAQRHLTKSDSVGEVIFEPETREISWDLIRRAREISAYHHDFHPDVETALWFFNIHEILTTIHGLMLALRVFLVVAGVTTLLVGAVGVMNIMLVVVGERSHEIGLRKAVGGSSRAIFVQFLSEAVTVCVLSGLLGVSMGIGFAQLVRRTLPPDSPFQSVPVVDPLTAATVAAALSLVGVVAGLVPALRASRVPPAEALRAL